jgi:peptidoglycan L-alanyl-D-glutamate endopeptidase CwlK
LKPGNKVTRARPGESYHQYGLAVDLVLCQGGKWSWKGSEKDWREMQRIGIAAGLEALDFELPHLQLAGLKIRDLQAGHYPAGGDASWLAVIGK